MANHQELHAQRRGQFSNTIFGGNSPFGVYGGYDCGRISVDF